MEFLNYLLMYFPVQMQYLVGKKPQGKIKKLLQLDEFIKSGNFLQGPGCLTNLRPEKLIYRFFKSRWHSLCSLPYQGPPLPMALVMKIIRLKKVIVSLGIKTTGTLTVRKGTVA
jgi:hypothetical protein